MTTTVQIEKKFIYRRLTEPFQMFGKEYAPEWWWAVIIPILLVGIIFVTWMYVKDARRIRWYGAAPLALLRLSVYGILVYLFLMPANETWEIETKRKDRTSRVIVMLDVSRSMTVDNADPAASNGKLIPRIDRVLSALSDDEIQFLQRLLQQNAVYVYRFGKQLDDEAQGFELVTRFDSNGEVQRDPSGQELKEVRPIWRTTRKLDGSFVNEYLSAWSKSDWDAFVRYDLKPWMLKGVSEQGQAIMRKHPLFGRERGDFVWASEWNGKKADEIIPDAESLPAGERLSPEDAAILKDNRRNLRNRIDVAARIATGTNVPQSILDVMDTEGANIIQGIVVFSDGRGVLEASEATDESRKRVSGLVEQVQLRASENKIPIFAVYIGEAKEKKDKIEKKLRVTDLQAPNQTPPDEPFKVIVEVDGEGLANQKATVILTLQSPGDGPKQDFETEVTFDRDDPPHAQATFVIDPAKVEKDLLDKSGREMISGIWKASAKAIAYKVSAGGKKDIEAQAETQEQSQIRIEKKPLRILIVASAGNRDFQFLFNQLERDKADMSLFLQNEGGLAGNISLLAEPERLLKRFPDKIKIEEDENETPEERWYNLARYDIIIAFDPDWTMFSEEQIKLIQTWVDLQAGSFVLVCGPLHVKKLNYVENQQKFAPLMELLPVTPGDYDLKMLSRDLKVPRRLVLDNVGPEAEFIKIDDSKDDPQVGWNLFFYERETPGETARLVRGFYNYYPVKDVKLAAKVILRFDDGPQARENTFDKKDPPFLVTYKYGQGMTAFIGSSEIWRLRQYDNQYFERFWTKLTRSLTAGSRRKQNRRGRMLMSPVVTTNSFIRPRVQLLDPSLQPLPATAEPPLKLRPLELDLESYPKAVLESARKKGGKEDEFDDELLQKAKEKYHQDLIKNQSLKLKAAKGGDGLEAGWFQAQILAAPDKFPSGTWVAETPIPNSSELLRQKFVIRRLATVEPELEVLKPDPDLMARVASSFSTIEPILRVDEKQDSSEIREKKDKVRAILQDGAYKSKKYGDRLAFDFKNTEAVKSIPDCLQQRTETQVEVIKNKGPIEDLWDRGFDLPKSMTSWFNADRTYHIAYFMLLAIGLLSVEWVIRKLLKLA